MSQQIRGQGGHLVFPPVLSFSNISPFKCSKDIHQGFTLTSSQNLSFSIHDKLISFVTKLEVRI